MSTKILAGALDEWPRWKIAVTVGAAATIGAVGIWYATRERPKTAKQKPPQKPPQIPVSLTPLDKAMTEKATGNSHFKGGRYQEAIDCYKQAIDLCPIEKKSEISTFYQNKAAAHEQLKQWSDVIDDCTKALDLNMKYSKALQRRARACEVTSDLMQCLEDITAVCILESFANPTSLTMAERVLKRLGKEKAAEAIKNRTPVAPSPQYITTYFSTFCNDPIMEAVHELSDKEQPEPLCPFKQALVVLRDSKDYNTVIPLVTEELETLDSENHNLALLLRATFRIIYGDHENALKDLNDLLNTNTNKRIRSNALIKRGSLRLQLEGQTDALDDLASAIRDDPENSDIYHHRGQLNLLIDHVEEAVKDFQISTTLSPNFAIAQVQKCYTEYRYAFMTRSPMQLQSSMQEFEETLKRFPTCAEGYALYGQALCDQQQFELADENFKKAIENEPTNANIYVHRGLLALQWKSDSEASADLIMQALKIDDKCEFAIETLGTIEVQRGNLTDAIMLFEKAIELAKTEVEMSHLFSLRDAAVAQSRVAEKFGIPASM